MATSAGTGPRLRALALGEVLDVSIKLCLAHWRTLLKVVLVIGVPLQILTTLLTADYTASSFDFSASAEQTPEEAVDDFVDSLGGLAISSVLGWVALMVASAACFRAIGLAYLGTSTDWRSSLSYAWRRLPSLLWLGLLYGLALLFGTLLLIAPGVWLYVAWAFATPVLLLEGLRGRRALGRSFALVKGRWWRTFGVLAVGLILAGVVSTLVQGVFFVGILVNPGNDVLVLVLATIAGILGLAIATPFVAALTTVVYFDLRIRKEGFDLELLAREIGASPSAIGDVARAATMPAPALSYGEEIDRSSAPYWPPPPGWKPPERSEDDEPSPPAGAPRE